MKDNFDACLTHTLAHEGGYVNDPHDPGGETNLGISKRSYPREDIRNMTRERAAAIYRRDFWDAVSGDELPAGLDLVAFDAAVNSGVMRGSQWVQRALLVEADGRIGPHTIKAARALDSDQLDAAISRAMAIRFGFLTKLKTWQRYRRGWTARVEAVESAALSMAKKARRAPAAKKPAPAFDLAWFFGLVSAALRYFFAKGK